MKWWGKRRVQEAVDIDNNFCEREFRYVASGRHNWMFVGSERGARAYSTHLTLVRNCVQYHVNPLDYYRDILRRLPSHPQGRLEELLPKNWEPAPPLGNRIVIPAMYSTSRTILT